MWRGGCPVCPWKLAWPAEVWLSSGSVEQQPLVLCMLRDFMDAFSSCSFCVAPRVCRLQRVTHRDGASESWWALTTGSSSLRGSGSSVLHCGTVGTGYPGAMGALWSPGEGARGQACTGLGRLCTAPAEEAGTSWPDPRPPSFRQRSVRPHCASQGTQGRCAAWRVWEVCQRLTGRERQRLRSEECTERWRLTSLFTCHVPRPQHPPSDPRLCSWELRAVAREDRRQSEGTPALTLTPQGFLEVQVSCLSHPLIPAPAVCQAKRSFLKAALWAAPEGLLSGLLLDRSLCGSPGRSQPIAKQVPRSGLAGRHSW